MGVLNGKKAELKAVEDDLGELQAKLKGAEQYAQELNDDVELCGKKLERWVRASFQNSLIAP